MSNAFEQVPILEWFTLRRVHGYKDITINFVGPATVIVAENGTGKTTVLSALNAFLTRRFHRLAALSFTSLECKFCGAVEPIVLSRTMVDSSSEDLSDTLRELSKAGSFSEDELLDFIQNDYSPENFLKMRSLPMVRQLYVTTPGDWPELKRSLDNLYVRYTQSLSLEAKNIASQIRSLLKGVEVVYLPTYRRIERPLLRASKRRAKAPGIPQSNKQDYTYEGIAFGLGDIEARLAEISEEIERTSNIGYRNLSARILEDMMTGKSTRPPSAPDDLPNIKTLSLFLGRLGRSGRSDVNLGGIFENIENLYESNDIYDEEYEFLRYFLSRLNAVINDTKSLEQKIEQFVTVCNSYLKMSSDEKFLAFDPRALKVVVQNSWADCTFELDALSSGEKQIVSLMARLYLYEGKKLIIIDEPELSLSLEWQRKVLPDVLESGSVVQMLAVTHSPFIFENSLDPFATGLTVTRTVGSQDVEH